MTANPQTEDTAAEVEVYYTPEEAQAVLPAWFVPRMMEAGGLFGVMLVNGTTLAVEYVERLYRLADGALWLDAQLAPAPTYASRQARSLFYAPAAAPPVSINLAHVVAVFEAAAGMEASGWDGAALTPPR